MKRVPMPGRSSPMARSTALTRTALRRKRASVSPEEATARRLVMARAAGRCEGCGVAAPLDWAHRVARSQGGRWCASNGQALCRHCHEWATRQPASARAVGWSVRRGEDPAQMPTYLHGIGLTYLSADGTYASLPTERTA